MVLDVQTLVSASPLLKSEKGTTIRASAVVEVPSHPEIARKIFMHQYVEWKPIDLFHLSVDFTSTLKPDVSGKTSIANELRVSLTGNEKQSEILKEFPIEFHADVGRGSVTDFWGSSQPLTIFSLADKIELARSEITTDKAVSEPEGIIRVGQGKETYAVIPVSYFGPTP
jgi:hypothetical protein